MGNGQTLRDVALGAAGGIVGTYAMGLLSKKLYSYESEEKRRREEAVRSEPPFMVLAERLLHQAGAEVTDQRKERLGMTLHWGYGMAWGAGYALLRRRIPALRRVGGLPFGLAFALLGDEMMNAVMGLSAPPKEFPIEAHLRGLAGHVAFAAAAEGALRGADAIVL